MRIMRLNLMLMSGSITYSSESVRKICRIDILCDSYARDRLVTSGFIFDHEPIETYLGIDFYRGRREFNPPVFTDEFTFKFVGIDIAGAILDDGRIRKVEFFVEADFTAYDSPIMPVLSVLGDPQQRNNQEGVFYYEEGGRYYCAAVNTLSFTESEFRHLMYDPALRTTLRLNTELGKVSSSSLGALDMACISQSIFIPVKKIINVPSVAYVGNTVDLENVAVQPARATNKVIQWIDFDGGGTGAYLSGNKIFGITDVGTILVTALIAGGKSQGADFTQTFSILVIQGSGYGYSSGQSSQGGLNYF